eukprot:scaffold6856_cov156-Amphora_coffeaeformis.AAC.13
MCQRSVTGGSEFIPVPVPGREMLRLLPMLSSLKVTFVNDNAKRPAHSVSEEKRRRTPVKKTLSKSRWESTAKFVTVLPTQGAILKDAVCDTIDSDEVRKPSRRPSINEEALSKVSTMFVDDDCDSWSPTSVTKAAHLAHSRADSAFRSSIEARKPCRQPSLDQDVRQQLAQFADEFDDDSAEETVKRSSLSLRKPSRAPSLSRVQEGMNESTQSLQEILGVIQAEFGDKISHERSSDPVQFQTSLFFRVPSLLSNYSYRSLVWYQASAWSQAFRLVSGKAAQFRSAYLSVVYSSGNMVDGGACQCRTMEFSENWVPDTPP